MCDKELLVSYLYDELQGPERKAFQHHLVSCRDCQQEVQGLRATRSHLESWPVPEPALGLQLPAAEAVARSRFRMSPAWGLAAAAVLVLAVASAVANLEITAGAEGLTIRTGWSRAGSVPPAGAAADAASRQDVVAIQQRVRELEAALDAEGIDLGGSYPSLNTLELFRSAAFAPRLRSSAPALDYAALSMPHAEHAAEHTLWLDHRMLLAEPEDVCDISRALARVQANAAAIARGARGPRALAGRLRAAVRSRRS